MFDSIAARIDARQRISVDDARWLYQHATDGQLQDLASRVRARFHPPDRATYLVMGIVNYTNVCVARCDYCAFYRFPGDPDTYLLSEEQVARRIAGIISLGGTMVSFNGGFHPHLRIEDYTRLFQGLRRRFPDAITYYEMTVAEFMFICKRTGISYAEGARRFVESGTKWISGGGAEVLADSFRLRHSPGKYKVEDFYEAQAAVLDAGLGSTATMVIGFDETIDERLEHIDRLRQFQDSRLQPGVRGALASFLCWTYKPYNTELGGEELPTADYLRWLAVCRIFLDNFEHIRTSVLTRNEDALLGLRYGADDFDLPTEDEVTEKAGATISLEFERILDSARRLGFTPVHRAPLPVAGRAA